MNAYERLLKYVVIRTPSNEESETTPSSQCQFDLANVLKKEMEELGICDVTLTDTCFLYGKIPATPGCENAPAIGFIAHMDTVSDYCDHDIKPTITENYDGEALALGQSELVLSPEMFPHLKTLKGRTLITSDGTTILGADDKAGIAEILTMVERMNKENISHGYFASHLPQMKKLELVQRILMLISSVLILHTHWTEIQKMKFNTRILMHVVLWLNSTESVYTRDLPKIRWSMPALLP